MALRIVFLWFVALFLLVSPTLAVTLHGVVTDDSSRAPIEDVIVTIVGPGARAPEATASNGSFTVDLSIAPDSPITLRFEKPGYVSLTLHDVATDKKEFVVSLVPSKELPARGLQAGNHDRVITDPALYYASQLRAPDVSASLSAAQSIARFQLNTPTVIDALIFALQNKPIEVRIAAAQTLDAINVKGPAAVPSLIICLEDTESAKLRSAAAATLGLLGKDARPAVKVLNQSLSDADDTVRENAAFSLVVIDSASAKPAVETLCELLASHWNEYNESGAASRILDLVLKGRCSSGCMNGIARNVGSSPSEPETQQNRELQFLTAYGTEGRQALQARLVAVDDAHRDRLLALMGNTADRSFMEDLLRAMLHTLDSKETYNYNVEPILAAEQLDKLDASAHPEIVAVLIAAYKHREVAAGPLSQKHLGAELMKFPPEGPAFLLADLQTDLSANKLWLVDDTAPMPNAAPIAQAALKALLSRTTDLLQRVRIAGKILETEPWSDDSVPILMEGLLSEEDEPHEFALSFIQTNQKSLSAAGAQQVIMALVQYVNRFNCLLDERPPHCSAEQTLLLSFGDPAVLALANDFRTHQNTESASILSQMGAGARLAVPVAIQAIQENQKDAATLECALSILSAVGPDSAPAVPVIIPLLEFKDNQTQDQAANTLKAIGPGAEAALPALKSYAARRHRQETWDSIKGTVKAAFNP